ncbi:hypothetical protein LCGC14_2429300, partial [marine sediment metagenome]
MNNEVEASNEMTQEECRLMDADYYIHSK